MKVFIKEYILYILYVLCNNYTRVGISYCYYIKVYVNINVKGTILQSLLKGISIMPTKGILYFVYYLYLLLLINEIWLYLINFVSLIIQKIDTIQIKCKTL